MRRNTRTGYVPRTSNSPGKTVRQIVTEAIAGERIDDLGRDGRINQTLGRAGFTDDTPLAETLSGGWKRRLAIARELVRQPDLLFLDEPTNHLDFEGIAWLEKLLANSPFASVVVSHDRYFLDNVVNDMAEIDRAWPDGIFRVEGSYSHFLEKKEEFLLSQANRQEALANRVRYEVEWLRRGAKARTRKSQARIDDAGRLIRELADLESRAAKSAAAIDFTATDRRTKRLISTDKLSKSLGGRALFTNLSFTLTPGTRLGLLGLNGTGKTTLLRLLSGEIMPDSGTVERAPALRVVYFDQTREQLDPTQTLRQGLGAHGDHVIFQGNPIHVAGWAKRFLFDSGQLDRPISSLSGGEQARVLIARLMLQPADLLLLDEPTNDLDIPTLEVLEDSLTEFSGALVLVTHDRYLLDRVSTAVLGLDGNGGAQLFSDYWQWEQAKLMPSRRSQKKESGPPRPAPHQSSPTSKLAKIEQMGAHRSRATARAIQPNALPKSSPRARLQDCYARLQAADAAIHDLYARWAELKLSSSRPERAALLP